MLIKIDDWTASTSKATGKHTLTLHIGERDLVIKDLSKGDIDKHIKALEDGTQKEHHHH